MLLAGWMSWSMWTLQAQIERLLAEQAELGQRLESVEQAVQALASRVAEAQAVAEAMKRLGSPASARERMAMAFVVIEAAEKYGVPVELVLAVGAVESHWRPDAVGMRGERGPLQVMPYTFWYLGMDCAGLACEIEAGVRYLALQVERAKGRPDVAVAYYHTGHNLPEGRAVRRARGYVNRVARAYRTLGEVLREEV